MSSIDPTWTKDRRIAILNWRDAGHPQAGGAETYCLAVARWLAAQGARVTLVTARAAGQPRRSVEDGVAIHRGGGEFGVYAFVFLWLLRRRPIGWLGRRGQIDAVLDCQNGIPFFSPLAVSRQVPVVLLVHHVHQEQFELHFGTRLAGVGRALEGPISRVIYGARPTISVSPSTRLEIRRNLRFRTPIYIVPNGGQTPSFRARTPSAHPTVVSVGRLVVQKHTDQLLVALAEARQTIGDLVLHIIGDGPELEKLERQADALALGGAVVFHGRLSDDARDAILDQSWMFLSASQREGWGVAVLEAAAHGVPALVRDVPGLRDAVRNGATGWLVPPGQSFSQALVDAIAELRGDHEIDAMADRCFAWARNFSWERTARRVTDILEHEALRLEANRPIREAQDLAARVEVDLEGAARTQIDQLMRWGRLTDEWRLTPTRLVGVLYGTDEEGARNALDRLGLIAHSSVGIARSHDLLGDVPSRVARKVAIAERKRRTPGVVTPTQALGTTAADSAALKLARTTDPAEGHVSETVTLSSTHRPKAQDGSDAHI